MTSRHTWSLLAALLAVSSIVRCGSAPPAAPGTPPPPTAPLRTFAGPAVAVAALLELEDRRAFDPSILESAARSTDPAVRARAALALGRIGDQRGKALLVALLGDRDPAVEASAAFGSQIMGDPTITSELIPLLSNREASVARAAARAIGFLGRGDGQDALIAAVDTSVSPEPRATILRSLWRFAAPATEQVALRFANDPDVRVRFGAVYAIARKPLESSLPALTTAVSDSDADIAAYAARALGILAKKESVEPLASALDSGKPPLVTNALVALEAVLEKNPGTSTGKERIARVLNLAGDANPNLAIPALTLLRQFAGADRDVFRRLWTIATTGTGYRRQVALSSATAVLRDNAFPALQTAASSPEAPLRAAAAEALGYLSFAKASALRSKLAADPSPLVRGALLASLRTAEAVSQNRALVQAAANDTDPGVRAAAVDALTRIEDASVIPLLSDAVSKASSVRDPDVPLAVIAAAEKLRGEPGAQALVEAAYRHPNPVVARIARRSLLQNFRVTPASFPPPEFRPSRSGADYLALVAESKKPWTASIETARGAFRVRLAGAAAPVTVMNFVSLAQKGYFNGSTFHRVVPNFVIQDGDPTGTGNGGPGYEIRDELNPIEYSEGTVGMALSGPDTGGSQWFVTHAPQPHLDGIYTVFGQVVAGQDVVERIEQGDRITRVSIVESPAP
ncbi:MAG TPA: HEAT repeat domain-containing protein [Thermoanaerobaculia bacterium]|nr:HEAT repeat domain-containing protein [Thermoanaerobaculia bacterium]